MFEPCTQQCSFCFLQFADTMPQDNLFSGLDKEEVQEIIRSVHHQVRSFSKGEVIIQEDEEYKSLIFILQGKVSTQIMNGDGQVLIVEQISAPATLAPAALFSTESRIPVSVVVEEEVKALMLPKASCKQMLAVNPIVMTNFLRIISNRLQFLTKKLKMLQFQSLRSKLIKHILELYTVQNTPYVVLQNTQQDLSEIFGVARPSLARTLRELHNQGLIEAKGKNIFIPDVKKLQTELAFK